MTTGLASEALSGNDSAQSAIWIALSRSGHAESLCVSADRSLWRMMETQTNAGVAKHDSPPGEHRRLTRLDIAAIGIVWTADDELIAWSDDRWQIIELDRD